MKKDLQNRQREMREQRVLRPVRFFPAPARSEVEMLELVKERGQKDRNALSYFYIVRPDPVNQMRVKFGVTRDPATRFTSYLCLCPEASLLGMWQIVRNMERRVIEILTDGTARKVSPEVYDIEKPEAFFSRVRRMQFTKASLEQLGASPMRFDVSSTYSTDSKSVSVSV